jgi:hypothetical protein
MFKNDLPVVDVCPGGALRYAYTIGEGDNVLSGVWQTTEGDERNRLLREWAEKAAEWPELVDVYLGLIEE